MPPEIAAETQALRVAMYEANSNKKVKVNPTDTRRLMTMNRWCHQQQEEGDLQTIPLKWTRRIY